MMNIMRCDLCLCLSCCPLHSLCFFNCTQFTYTWSTSCLHEKIKYTHSFPWIKTDWKILNWNFKGINSEKKWVSLASKIDESNCDIICLQETKRDSFDMDYIKKFCPERFNKFEFLP
jgi:hypothetical protein